STWGINLCRDSRCSLYELSSIADRGTFNYASKFTVLKGINVDFSKYFFDVGPANIYLDPAVKRPTATFSIPVKNMTGKKMKVKIDRWYKENENKDGVETKIVTMKPNEIVSLSAERIEVEPISTGRTDAYIIRPIPETKRVVVSDAKDGTILSVSFIKKPWYFETMKMEVENAWQRNMGAEKSSSISLKVYTSMSEKDLKNGELVVTVTSRETNNTLNSKRFRAPSEITDVSFPTGDLPWGAYDLKSVFKDLTGKEIISCHAVATVLPGGKNYINVFNNLVSELMNTKERGIVVDKEIEFMNPRDGWVFFSVSGAGNVVLDSGTKPILAVQSAKEPVETMRYLTIGRHVLHVYGKFDQIVIRSVPELIYSCWPTKTIWFEWNFLSKEVFPNCNTILGDGSDEKTLRELNESGKKNIGFAIAPGHGLGGKEFYTADRYYEKLVSHKGFKDPLMNGVIVDQIGSSSVEQKIEFVGALSRLAANPEFRGKSYQPWYEGVVFGSEGDKAFMKVVLEAGWPFSYYVYLVEQSSEKKVMADIQDTIVSIALSANSQIHGSLRRAVVTLGYWSDVTTGQIQDINPGINFKILMQMQMDALANDPALFGVYGVLWYYSPYVDEEILRWSSQLYRHYGMEGKTAKLTNDPYLLTHIQNPDFEKGKESWTITEAERGTVSVKNHSGYGYLQGRYLGGSAGDTFLVTKRSAKGPNKFSQEIKNLTPGRLYSMKMITADYGNIKGEKSVNQKDEVCVELDNVELVRNPGKNLQTTYPNHYGHSLGKFTGAHHAYMNYHWYVFRAKSNTAKLTVSDWISPNDPGGPVGQELMYNFIEVEPYLED
ncbi:MAG: hypothetical protein HQ542_05220, partial [Bacteroidia bacterium]|nr:hypothetical protein [Bacteroidia bacterium]